MTTTEPDGARGPQRIRLSRKKGYRLPRGAVNIARPGKWGNPFKAGEPNGLGWGVVNDHSHAAALFAKWLYLDHELVAFERDRHAWMLEHLEDLRGKDLACWCPLGGDCHGAVLLIAANSTTFANRNDHVKPPAGGEVDGRAVVAALLKIAAEARK